MEGEWNDSTARRNLRSWLSVISIQSTGLEVDGVSLPPKRMENPFFLEAQAANRLSTLRLTCSWKSPIRRGGR